MLSVCISIAVWNNYEQTQACIRSLDNMLAPPDIRIELVIVDNDSAQRQAEQLKSTKYPLKFIQSDDNLGFAGGHRLSVNWAQNENFDVIWLLNPDTIVNANAIMGLLEAYKVYGEGIYGSVLQSFEKTNRLRMQLFAVDELNRPTRKLAVPYDSNILDAFNNGQAIQVANVSGASIFIPMSIISKFGFMNEEFFMYAEEVDYCFRLLKENIKVYVVPESIVFHEIHGTSKSHADVNNMLYYYRIRNRLTYIRKHFGYWVFLKELLMCLQFRRLFRWSIKRLFFGHKLSNDNNHTYYYLGILHAFVHRMGRYYNPNDYLNVSWEEQE